jgi:hypothetical protein
VRSDSRVGATGGPTLPQEIKEKVMNTSSACVLIRGLKLLPQELMVRSTRDLKSSFTAEVWGGFTGCTG